MGYEVPFKNKTICITAYELMDFLIEHRIEKAYALIILDDLVNRKQVVVREIKIPELLFRQIHSRKTKGKSEIHLQMPRKDYAKLKLILKRLPALKLCVITTNVSKEASSLGNWKKTLEINHKNDNSSETV